MSGKSIRLAGSPRGHEQELICIYRGINEGRQAAREVDTYLMGTGSQLPLTGGIVRRPAIDSLPPIPQIQVQAVTA